MKKRKGSLLQRMMAVLLSAVLVAGMVSNAAPASVLAEENAGSPEEGEDRGGREEAGVIEEETGSGGGNHDSENGGSESDGNQAEGSESESGGGETEGDEQEGESREPGSVSGNDAEMAELAAMEEDMIITAADGTAALGSITSDQEWSTQMLAAGTYTISSGVTVTVSGKLTIAGDVTINGGGTLRWSSAGGYGNALEVQEGAQLTLENITLDGNNIWFSYSALLLRGNVAFNNGTVIQNFKTKGSSGSSAGYKGVIAVYEKGVLNIYDGVTITGNECGSGIIALYQFDSSSSGLKDSTATVNMYGGTITGNTVKSVVSDMGVIWNWCGNLNISGGTVTAGGGEYAVHTQGNNKSYNATTVISGGTFTGMQNGAVCAGKDSDNRSVIKITGGSFTGKIAATVNYGTIEIRGGVYEGTSYALSSNGSGALEVYGGEFTGGTNAYNGTINTNTEKVIVGDAKATVANWDRSTSLNTYKYVAIGELEQPLPSHTHDSITFTPWTSTDSLPTAAGNYYLMENVTLAGTWNVPNGTTNLCLNGKTIRGSSEESVIKIAVSAALHLYDCKNNGNITGGKYGVYNNGIFCMYGGKISGNIGDSGTKGSGVWTAGTFEMYGGEISGNSGSAYCGVYMASGIFCMYSGKISDNKGVRGVAFGNGTFTVGGDAVISGNTYDGQTYYNVYLEDGQTIRVDSDKPLSGSASIGVTTKTKPTDGNQVAVTGHNKGDYSRYFQSDNPAYEIINESDTVKLIVPHRHTPVKHEKISADCTNPGTGEYWKCEGTTGCGRMFSDQACKSEISQIPVISALGHFYESIWKKDASGHWHECSRCGAKADEADHSLGGWQSDEDGHWKICTDCNYQMTVAAHTYDNDSDRSCNDCGWERAGVHAHDLTLMPAKDATCTEDGNTAYYVCGGNDGCGKWFSDKDGTQEITDKDSVVISKTAHNYDETAWGYQGADGHAHKCSNCDAHDAVQEHTPGAAATETTPQTCTVCGYEIAPATGGGSSGGNENNGGNGSGNNNGGGNNSGNNNGNSQTAYNPDTAPVRVKSENQGNIVKEVTIKAEDTFDASFDAVIAATVSELADIVLTQEEKELADDGINIKIVLDIQDAQNTVSAADKAVVESALSTDVMQGFTVGQYLDVNLFKIINDNRSAIRETNKKIIVTIAVPDRLKNTDANSARVFAVVRVHNGAAEVLTDLDNSDDTITIATDRFSSYAIVYNDTADSGVTPGDNSIPNSQKDNEPKTGDITPLELYATLAMIAGFAYLLLYFTDRERGMTEEMKKELVARLVGWAKQGGRIRKYLALAAIFVLLVYYHSIGKKTSAEWKVIYGE